MSDHHPRLPSNRIQHALFAVAPLVFLLGTIPCAAENLPEVSARPPWTLLDESEDAETGYVLHQRKSPDSNVATFRLEATVDSSPEDVAVAATKYMADPENRPANTDKVVLRNDEEAIVVYSYIHIDAPFVSDRDVISRIERSYDPDSRTHRLAWRAVDEGPPKKKGVIRLELSEGSWTFAPGDQGKTRAIYINRTDSAGYLPAWLVHSQMSKTMVDGINGLRRVLREAPKSE
jgi:hypothetical protein